MLSLKLVFPQYVGKLGRNVLSNATATAIGSVIQVCLILGLSRWLSMKDFASFLTAVAVIGFGEMASDFGVRIWATREFAVQDSAKKTLVSAVSAKSIYSTLLLIVVMLLHLSLLSFEESFLAALIAITQPSTDPLLWFLRGRERLDVEAWVRLGWRMVNAGLLSILAIIKCGVSILLIGWLLTNILRFFLTWQLPWLKSLKEEKVLNWFRNVLDGKKIAWKVFPIGIAFLSMALYHRMGVLILGEISVPKVVALFGAAFTLVASAGFVATSITVSSFPMLARAIEKKTWDEALVIARRKVKWIMWLFAPGCIVGGILAPWIIKILYPPSYNLATVTVLALLPGLYISVINFSLKYLLHALGLSKADAISVGFGIIVFATILLIAPSASLLAVAGFGWGLGEIAIFCGKYVAIKKHKCLKDLCLWPHLIIFVLLAFSMWCFSVLYQMPFGVLHG